MLQSANQMPRSPFGKKDNGHRRLAEANKPTQTVIFKFTSS